VSGVFDHAQCAAQKADPSPGACTERGFYHVRRRAHDAETPCRHARSLVYVRSLTLSLACLRNCCSVVVTEREAPYVTRMSLSKRPWARWWWSSTGSTRPKPVKTSRPSRCAATTTTQSFTGSSLDLWCRAVTQLPRARVAIQFTGKLTASCFPALLQHTRSTHTEDRGRKHRGSPAFQRSGHMRAPQPSTP
jgi:hypothetical protein